METPLRGEERKRSKAGRRALGSPIASSRNESMAAEELPLFMEGREREYEVAFKSF